MSAGAGHREPLRWHSTSRTAKGRPHFIARAHSVNEIEDFRAVSVQMLG